MAWDFEAIAKQIDEEIKTVSDSKSLEFFRIKYLGKKTRKLKRKLRRTGYISAKDARLIRRLLPYG